MTARRPAWHMLRDAGVLTLTRRVPPRFDVVAETTLPAARKGALAHQIRQDIWRALQHLRGFSPVVRIEDDGAGLRVRAGGRVDARSFARAAADARIAEVLENPANRARWLAHARLDRGADNG